jgi:2-keto-4-pentenoate hydratase/2-oxohepta-3-ene-1,7-dioic acid hydratase in catechol pathway
MTKFVTFSADGVQHFGVAVDGGCIALDADFPDCKTMRDVIVAGKLKDVSKASMGRPVTHPNGSYTLDIPVPNPEKIICVGVNFPDRNAEYKDGQDAPPNMSLFPRFPRSFTGAGQSLVRPPESPQLDYEGEIAVIIGKGGRRIPQDQAYNHIAAISLANEGTIRDWVRHAKFNVTQGKNWDNSGSIGPWMIPFTHPSQLDDIRLTTHVNGELRQDDRTSRMLFPIKRQIEYISTFTTLVPGDIIITGTPTGAGARFDPPRFLVPGDEIVVEAEGIGRLVNGVIDEC